MEQIKRKRGRPRKVDKLNAEYGNYSIVSTKENTNIKHNLVEIVLKRGEVFLKVHNISEKDYLFFVSCFNALSGLADYYSFVKIQSSGRIQCMFSKSIPMKLYAFVFPTNFNEKNPKVIENFIQDLKTFIINFLKYYNVSVNIEVKQVKDEDEKGGE